MNFSRIEKNLSKNDNFFWFNRNFVLNLPLINPENYLDEKNRK